MIDQNLVVFILIFTHVYCETNKVAVLQILNVT
jgi:hypothetical protein